MKKVIIPLLALAMILLTSLLLGATSGQRASNEVMSNQSSLPYSKIMDTYWSNPFSSMPDEEENQFTSSIAYTEEQLALIDKAMEGIIKSVYLSKDSKEYQVIATQPSNGAGDDVLFQHCKLELSSLKPLYSAGIIDWVQTGKLKITYEPNEYGQREISGFFTDVETGQYGGPMGIIFTEDSWRCSVYNNDDFPYNAKDFYTNRVSIYENLQGTKLDLSKTTGKYVAFSGVSYGYYLTDGNYEYFLAVGGWDLDAMDNTGVNYFTRDVGKEYKVFEIKDLLEPAQKQVEANRLLAEEVARQTADGGGDLLLGGADLSGLDLSEPFNPLWIILPAAALVLGAGAALLIVKRKRTRQDD